MKIEIKPGDQTHVGKKVHQDTWNPGEWLKILFVGNEQVLAVNDDGHEEVYLIDEEWELYEEPKQKKLLAPAYVLYAGFKRVHPALFNNASEAKDFFEKMPECFLSWPAIPNAQGYYEVEE